MSNVSSDIFFINDGVLCVTLFGLSCAEGNLVKVDGFSPSFLGVPVAAGSDRGDRQW